MRVAYICEAPFISGAERSLQVMLDHVADVGVDPLVVAPPGSAIHPWCQDRQIPTLICPLARRDKWHPFRWLASIRRMRTLFRRHRIDLVHSNQLYSYPAASAAGRDLGLPRVCHLRDEVTSSDLSWWCASGVEALLCISRHIEGQAAVWDGQQSRPQLVTLLNPVLLPHLSTDDISGLGRSAARRQFGLPQEAIVFGFIGQLAPVKGLMGLLDVLGRLAHDSCWHLAIAGRDHRPGVPYETACRERIGRLGLGDRVTLVGFLDDVGPFYRAIDVAVVPSLVEPLGRIPLEAASYARPAIAFAAGGLEETIRDGETGWLVPPEDWDALGCTLKGFLSCPLGPHGPAARRWVETVVEPGNYARKVKSLYETLL